MRPSRAASATSSAAGRNDTFREVHPALAVNAAIGVARQAALCETDARLRAAGRRRDVTLQRTSIDCAWPADDFDLVVLSEVAYYLSESTLRRVLDSEVPKLMPGTTLLAAHWRHPVSDYRSMATQPTTSSARHRHCAKRPTAQITGFWGI
jgi:hypothetical protein